VVYRKFTANICLAEQKTSSLGLVTDRKTKQNKTKTKKNTDKKRYCITRPHHVGRVTRGGGRLYHFSPKLGFFTNWFYYIACLQFIRANVCRLEWTVLCMNSKGFFILPPSRLISIGLGCFHLQLACLLTLKFAKQSNKPKIVVA